MVRRMGSIHYFLAVCLCLLTGLQSVAHFGSPLWIFSGSGSGDNSRSSDGMVRNRKGSSLLLSRHLSIDRGSYDKNHKSEEGGGWITLKTSRRLTRAGRGGLERMKYILQLSGGAKGSHEDEQDEDDDEGDVDDDDDDDDVVVVVDDDDDDDDGDDETLDNDHQRPKMLTSVSDMWVKTPPITQAYVGSSMAITLAVFLLNKNVWPEMLNLDWGAVISKLQFWRPFTAFLFFGPLGLNYVLTMQFVWTYMAQLEKLNYNKPEEFFMMLLFGAATLMVGYAGLGFSTQFLGHNLSTFLVYIWARTFEGTDVNVMDLFCLKAELLPWFFCVQTYLLEGEIPFADILGIIVGHLYHYIFLEKKMKTFVPSIVRNFFSSETMQKKYARFKDDFE